MRAPRARARDTGELEMQEGLSKSEISRYGRQLILPEFGVKGEWQFLSPAMTTFFFLSRTSFSEGQCCISSGCRRFRLSC